MSDKLHQTVKVTGPVKVEGVTFGEAVKHDGVYQHVTQPEKFLVVQYPDVIHVNSTVYTVGVLEKDDSRVRDDSGRWVRLQPEQTVTLTFSNGGGK